jgi:RHS repeat-associated protein
MKLFFKTLCFLDLRGSIRLGLAFVALLLTANLSRGGVSSSDPGVMSASGSYTMNEQVVPATTGSAAYPYLLIHWAASGYCNVLSGQYSAFYTVTPYDLYDCATFYDETWDPRNQAGSTTYAGTFGQTVPITETAGCNAPDPYDYHSSTVSYTFTGDPNILPPSPPPITSPPPGTPHPAPPPGALGPITAPPGATPYFAEPVNVTSGAFSADQVDLHVNGPLPIEIRRNYSSLNVSTVGEFGYGWVPGYFSYLDPSDSSDDPASIRATDAAGAIIVFEQQEGSTTLWAPTLRANPLLANSGGTGNPFNSTIVQTVSGGHTTYTWNLPDGSVRTYVVQSFAVTLYGVTYQQTRPYLSTWADNRGNQLTFTYGNDSSTNDFGRINLIQSSNGSSVSLQYDAQRRIILAQANDGRSVKYTYDVADSVSLNNGDLTQVELPDSSVVSYQYEAYSDSYSDHRIAQVTKPDNRILQNTYDELGRVLQQSATVGNIVSGILPVTATFDYSVPGQTTAKDANNNSTVYQYNANNLITKITDPLGHSITQTWYTATGAGAYINSLQSVTDKRGLVTNYQYDAQGNNTETDVIGNLTGDLTAGTATAKSTYNSLNLPLTVTNGSGITTSYTYDPIYKYLPATSATSIGVNSPPSRIDNISYTSTAYAKGLLASKTVAVGSPDATTTSYSYDPAGFLLQQVSHTGTGDPDVVTNFTYNTHGELVTATDGDGRTTTYAYDGKNGDGMSRPISKVVTDENGNIIGSWTLSYDGNGDLSTTTGPRTAPAINTVQRTYDGAGNLEEEVVALSHAKPDGSGVTPRDYAITDYGYDFANNLVMEVDPNGNETTMTYDPNGQMLSKETAGLRTESYTYEPGGNVATYTNPLGGVTNYYYTDTGQLSEQDNPDGSVLKWRYQTDSRLQQEILRNGSVWTTTYDDVNRIVTRVLTNATGTPIATEISAYDRRGNLISHTDPDGFVKTTTYDGLDRVKTSSGPAAVPGSAQQTTTYFYGKSRKTFTTQNALGEQTVTTSDAIDRPMLVQVFAAGTTTNPIRTTSYTYSADHNAVTVTEGTGAGAISKTTYTDTLDRPVLTVLGDGTFTTTTYDLNGNLSSTTDALKQTTSYAYNGLNQLISQTLPDGTVTNFTSDASGNPLTRAMANGALTQAQTYDNAGRKLTEKLYSGSATTRQYSYAYYPAGTPDAGLLQTVTAPRDTVTTTYDDFLRPSTVTTSPLSALDSQLSTTSTYTYDLRSLVTGIAQIETVNGEPTTVNVSRTYDGYGQLLTETVTAGGTTYTNETQTWDAAGRRATLNDASSSLPAPLFTYTHRADGLLTQVTAPGTLSSGLSALNYSFSYSDNGLLTNRSNPFRVMTVDTRDPVGRILQQSQGVNSTTPLTENMTWRGNSTLASYAATRTGTGAWNESRAYGYDPRGQLLSEGFSLPSSPSPLASRLNYTFDGNNPGLGVRLDAKIGTGAPTSWETNATPNTLGQVTADNQVAASGHIVPASGTASSAGQVNILVDGILQGYANYFSGTWSMNLDLAAGSHTLIAKAVDPSGLTTATASSTFTVTGGNSSRPAGTVTSTYDADGNVISRSWTSGVNQVLTWDAFGRLIQVSQRDGTNNGYNWSAVYDGLGRRISTTQQPVMGNNPSGTATVTASIYDPQVEFLEIGVNVNGAKAWKVYGPDLNGRYGGLQGTGGLEAVVMDAGGAATGVLNDYFGNGVATISGGSVTWNTTKVGGYGPLPDSTATPLTDISQLAASTVWRGHRIDATGFYYLGARYYEPTSGRFLSPDPKGQAASMSLYDYAGGDPVNNFDPDGRCMEAGQGAVQYADNGAGPGNGTNISNNDPTTGGQNPSDPNYPSPQQMAATVNQIWDSAQASASSYDMGKTAPPGYSVSQVYTAANNGTDAVLYQNNTTGAYILAYRGTQSMSDAGTDIYNGAGGDSTRYQAAANIAQEVQAQYGNNVILAGHSLGGGEAALASVATGLSAYTFNAAGVNPANYGYNGSNTSQITNYHVVGEPLSNSQSLTPLPDALGNQVPIPAVTTPTRSNSWNHSMSSVISSLSSLGLPAK